MPLFESISASAKPLLGEFDIQGLSNTLWSFASLLLPSFPIFSEIQSVVVAMITPFDPLSRFESLDGSCTQSTAVLF